MSEAHPIDEIVDGDWWNQSARQDYIESYDKMLEKGFSSLEARALLSRCYWATASCYGE